MKSGCAKQRTSKGNLAPSGRTVLYVHGGIFPSALSIAHRFDDRSWRDELCAAGFHVWASDFYGFGRFSDPYPEMQQCPEGMAPLGRAKCVPAFG